MRCVTNITGFRNLSFFFIKFAHIHFVVDKGVEAMHCNTLRIRNIIFHMTNISFYVKMRIIPFAFSNSFFITQPSIHFQFP